ncbi:MAG TPA: kelch repeat-containing protein [Actinomycetes bacterium]
MGGTWGPLTNQPSFNASTALLLTDGTVMCQDSGTANWWKLTPDQFGNYVNGTWSSLATGPNSPLYYASGVLRDGRVFVAGGEYNNGAQVELLAAEVYDPVANTWTSIGTPAGWTAIGDAASCVLPDGRVMLGYLFASNTAIYDPVANNWTAAANKLNASSSEETWTLLPDQTVLTVNCPGHPQTQKYVIPADTWVSSGPTPNDLVEAASIEIGPAVLLADGRVFAVGATNHTALYTMPPVANQAGTWADGPSFPAQAPNQTLGAKDAPACLLPNGKVLCVAGPVDGVSGDYLSPTYFFEFDPVAGTLTAVTRPANSGGPPFVGRMLLLPTGQVLFANGSQYVAVYTPDGGIDPSWAPQITTCPTALRPGWTYTLQGRQLNGLSQAVSYGDDAMAATNYPLVRLVSASHTFYCRTRNHSTMGVATGTVIQSTKFTVPNGVPTGSYQLCVIANGICSSCRTVNVSTKIIKELKWEKELLKNENKELLKNETKENIKIEKENLKLEHETVKDILENKTKDAEVLGQQGDLDWSQVIKTLVERSDAIEEAVAQERAFIRPQERPAVGEAALEEAPPAEGPAEGVEAAAAALEIQYPVEVLEYATSHDLPPVRHREGEDAPKRPRSSSGGSARGSSRSVGGSGGAARRRRGGR